MISYFQFTPDISVKLVARQHVYHTYFGKEYWFARRPEASRSSVTVTIVDKLPKKRSKNSVYRLIKFKNLFWYEYLVEFSKGSIDIYVKSHWTEVVYMNAFGPFIQTNVLEPVLYYYGILHGYYLLHASTVAKDGKATCFVGKGGAGKTMTALRTAMSKKMHLMGDDLIWLELKNRNLYYFPRPLHLFSYNIMKIPRPQGIVPTFIFWKTYFKVRVKDLIRKTLALLFGSKVLISTRVAIRVLYPNLPLEKKAVLATIEAVGVKKKVTTDELLNASDLRSDLKHIINGLKPSDQQNFFESEKKAVNSFL